MLIYHISDIHIYNKNYINLRNSFQILIDTILKNKGLLVIAGDVFENRSHITPDDIVLFYWMCDLLEKNEIETIMVPGNHDINPKYELSSISSLINPEKNQYKYIHILEKSWQGEFLNIYWFNFNPCDNAILNINNINNINNNKLPKIAILHEIVGSSVFDNGERPEGERFSAKKLSELFDITILGDIHKPQFLTEKKMLHILAHLFKNILEKD